MLKRQARVVAAGVFCSDLVVTVGAFLLAHAFLRAAPLPRVGVIYDFGFYAWLLLVIVPAWAILLQISGVYRSWRTAPLRRELWRIARAVLVGGLALFAFQAAAKTEVISRALLGVFLVLDLALLAAWHAAVRLLARRTRARGYNYRTVLIVGTGEKAHELARRIEARRHWGLVLLGHVSEGPRPAGAPPDPAVLGDVADIPRILRERVVDEVLVTADCDRLPDLEALFLHCEQVGVNVRLVVDFFPHLIAKVDLEDLDGVPLLTFSTTPRDEWGLAAKRAADVLFSGVFLIAFSWLYLLVMLLVKTTSRGPVFYRQERMGLYGRRFTLYKFRSMTADADARRAEVAHLNQMDGPVFKAANDPRVTPLGRLLRKFSVDEFPQMWNVFTGDMSLVGPRPPVPAEVEKYETWQRRRLSMRPGLTCLWQVSGRNTIDFQKWMELDLEYIDNWSLGLDLRILLKTVPAVVSGKGAS